MARPNRTAEKREALLPLVARAFTELGYRRATTAAIARRCRVRENVLYRLWEDKRAMFIAAIGHVGRLAREVWSERGGGARRGFSPRAVLEYESEHLGEFGNYRILFAALAETDDALIRRALRDLYRGLHAFLSERLAEPGRPRERGPGLRAWALLGLGTMVTITRELDLLGAPARRRLLREIGGTVLDG